MESKFYCRYRTKPEKVRNDQFSKKDGLPPPLEQFLNTPLNQHKPHFGQLATSRSSKPAITSGKVAELPASHQ